MTLHGCASGDQKPAESQKTDSPPTKTQTPVFDGERAFQYLTAVVDFGPRNPGSAGHDRCLNYLAATLRGFAEEVRLQTFTHRGYLREELHLTNIIASFNPKNESRILLCSHWDTRPRAERDRDPSRWDEPMLGANDGGSGVAVLLEVASLLKKSPPNIGVDIVLFDGEDYGLEGDTPNYLLGSRHFAETKPSTHAPRFGILLDMVGDENLEIFKEEHSLRYAPDIVSLVWQTAADLGYPQFINQPGEAIIDDHLPLNEAGIRTIDLIDFAYPDESHRYWHTHEDTPDKCSAASLEAVGTVLTHVVYLQEP